MYTDSPSGISNTAKQSSPVTNLTAQCNENLKRLHETISQLEDRINAICTPQPPNTAAGQKDSAPTPLMSSHVMFLGQTAMGLEDATIRLNRLMSRVEL